MNKLFQRFLTIFICITFLFTGAVSHAAEYRIDSQKEFDRLSKQVFQPGDEILFKRGARFTGMFTLTGEGSSAAPIRLAAYGKGNERPRIDAEGKHKAGLLLLNPSFVEVSGLEITNTNGSDGDQGSLCGIYVVAKGKEGVYEHVYIDDFYIHHVNGKVGGKERGGIHVHITDLKQSKFHDLRITNNRIEYVGGVGIGNASSCAGIEFGPKDEDVVSRNLWTKVYVADNYVGDTGRNNIIARVGKDAVYERNVLANSSRYSTGHSIFSFASDGIKIQYNEAYGNVGEGHDRGGFDADYNCINTYIQYNYSHDNEWFCGIMRQNNRNVVIRYNVSQNDRKGIYFYGFKRMMQAKGVHIYNNTHYVAKGLDVEVFAHNIPPLNSTFENNIFYFEGKGKWNEDLMGQGTLFNNNLYVNVEPHPSDSRAFVAHGRPLFVDPGKVGTGIDLKTMNALRGYRLLPGSPYLGGAIPKENNGGQNILKEKLSSDKHPFGALNGGSGERQAEGDTKNRKMNPAQTVPHKERTIGGIEMVWCPAGSFKMGSENGDADESPVHEVTITQGFLMGKYEVTKAQWKAVMGTTPWTNLDSPWSLDDPDSPAVCVSWENVQEFIKALNAKTDESFRLPTEAEWEYACRAGTTTAYSFGDDSGDLSNYAWYLGSSKSAHVVGQRLPNPWGLYDMHGNVWEWCLDTYGSDYYANGPMTDPMARAKDKGQMYPGWESDVREYGLVQGASHVIRGGSWGADADDCRSASRYSSNKSFGYGVLLGFRIVIR